MNKFISIPILCLLTFCVKAADVYQLPDPAQQKVYEDLTAQLRCLVCQNQTIADSHAELAGDLRRQVYEMLQQGKSRDEIVTFMTDRYGDFVLYNPPFKAKTGLLWLGPLAFLLTGLFAVFWYVRRRKAKTGLPEMDKATQKKIKQLLENEDLR